MNPRSAQHLNKQYELQTRHTLRDLIREAHQVGVDIETLLSEELYHFRKEMETAKQERDLGTWCPHTNRFI